MGKENFTDAERADAKATYEYILEHAGNFHACWKRIARDLKRLRRDAERHSEGERMMRDLCAKHMGTPLDQQSPEIGDIAIALDL